MADETLPETKTCTKCGETKPLSGFVRQARGLFGRRADCKECFSAWRAARRLENLEGERRKGRARYWRDPEAARAATKKWRDANRESDMARDRAYKDANRELLRQKDRERIAKDPAKHNEKCRRWRAENPEKSREIVRKSAAKNREKTREREARRRASSPKFRLIASVRAGVHRGLRLGEKRGRSSFALLGYTQDQLVAHLERQFGPGMSWDNYGEWHIDHIVPLKAFNFEKPEDLDFQKAWSLRNLRPLWADENHKKRARLDKPFQPSLLIGV